MKKMKHLWNIILFLLSIFVIVNSEYFQSRILSPGNIGKSFEMMHDVFY